MIETKLIVGISIVVTAVAYVLENRLRRGKHEPKAAFRRKGQLLSPAERAFLSVLEQAIGDQGRVFSMVRVADVLDMDRGVGGGEWHSALQQIQGAHFDFVVCSPDPPDAVGFIDVHGGSHPREAGKQLDPFLAGAWPAASLPLIQLPWQQNYDVSEIRSLVLSRLAGVAIG